jgi:hypothetical protein
MVANIMSKLMNKARTVFHKFIRERDKHKGCISCGTGKVEHAGHYFSAGHYSALRFSEINTNGQCVRCNYFLSGNAIPYRASLVKRYGESKVLALENNASLREVKKWSEFELEQIIKLYRK